MKLKNIRTGTVSTEQDGRDLVALALADEAEAAGELEIMKAQIARLGKIVGSLLDTLPPEVALNIAELWHMEIVE